MPSPRDRFRRTAARALRAFRTLATFALVVGVGTAIAVEAVRPMPASAASAADVLPPADGPAAQPQVPETGVADAGPAAAPAQPVSPDMASLRAAPRVDVDVAGSRDAGGRFVSPPVVTLGVREGEGGAAAGATRAAIVYRLDGGPERVYAGPLSLEGGRHHLTYSAHDAAGESGPAETLDVVVDTDAPVAGLVVDGVTANGWFHGPVHWRIAGGDPDSGVAAVTCAMDGFSLALGPTAESVPGARPSGGAASSAAGPSVAGPDLGVDDPLRPRAASDASARDARAVVGSLIAGAARGEGTHRVDCAVTDAVGHETDVAGTFGIDTVPPTIDASVQGVAIAGPRYFPLPLSVSIAAWDGGSGVAEVDYALDGGPSTVYAGSFGVSGIGKHQVVYTARDAAGNASDQKVLTFWIAEPQGAMHLWIPALGISEHVRVWGCDWPSLPYGVFIYTCGGEHQNLYLLGHNLGVFTPIVRWYDAHGHTLPASMDLWFGDSGGRVRHYRLQFAEIDDYGGGRQQQLLAETSSPVVTIQTCYVAGDPSRDLMVRFVPD